MRRRRRVAASLAAGSLLAVAIGCGGESAPLALGEPIRVPTATFKSGPLPGVPADADGAVSASGPRLTTIQTLSGIAFAGQTGKVLSGRTSTDAVAIAIRLSGAGSGYWVQPLGVADLLNGGELTFELRLDFAADAPVGTQTLELAALDAAGTAGVQSALSLCVDGVVPDNFNPCAPQLAPPAAVLSLSWDTLADLDLQVTTPEGKLVDAKHPNTVGPGATATAVAAGGILDRDAQVGCRAVGPRRENLVWQKPPTPGRYLVRVNLFDACGAASARFAVTVYRSSSIDGVATPLVAGGPTVGTLLSTQANGGAAPGLFIGAFDL